MKIMFSVAAALALTAVVPTLTDVGTVRASHGRHLFLAEASGPTGNGHDTALYAETESNGASPGSHDSAMLAEANSPTGNGHDTALYAETESNGPSPGGRDHAQA